MNTAQSFITLAIGIVAGVGLTAAAVATAQTNPAVRAAEELARRNAGVVIQSQPYTETSVNVDGERIVIFEDHRRNRVCYIRNDTRAGIDCDVLDRRNPR